MDGHTENTTEDTTEDTTPAAQPPVTGDDAVDEALVEFARAQAGSMAERIEAGERMHTTLQGRLRDLGGT